MPGNFLKKNESVSSLKDGAILTEEAIEELYQKDTIFQSELRYILHTDPELEPNHKLDWDKATWRREFAEMIINISRYFEVEPSIIEIHPSAGMKNPFGCIVAGIIAILDSLQKITCNSIGK